MILEISIDKAPTTINCRVAGGNQDVTQWEDVLGRGLSDLSRLADGQTRFLRLAITCEDRFSGFTGCPLRVKVLVTAGEAADYLP